MALASLFLPSWEVALSANTKTSMCCSSLLKALFSNSRAPTQLTGISLMHSSPALSPRPCLGAEMDTECALEESVKSKERPVKQVGVCVCVGGPASSLHPYLRFVNSVTMC